MREHRGIARPRECIIDPTKVVRIALENAVSVASILLLTEATLTDIPEKESPAQPPFPE